MTLLWLLFGLLFLFDSASAQTLEQVVARLEGTYRETRDLKAEFKQAAFNKTLNQTIEGQGTVWLKKPGKMRWEFKKPTPQTIVSDGKSLWIYTPELKQVTVSEAPATLGAGPAGAFLMGMGRLREEFTIRFLNPANPTDANGHAVLDLRPKKREPTLARLIVTVDPTDSLIRTAVIHDVLENTVTVRFTTIEVNRGLPESFFTFAPPRGVAVVPLQSFRP